MIDISKIDLDQKPRRRQIYGQWENRCIVCGKWYRTYRRAADRICAFCAEYTFRRRDCGGWAFCKARQAWFEDEKSGIPAGKRTCDQWRER